MRENNLKNNNTGIHKVRDYIINSSADDEIFVRNYIADFYITSEIIDLLFHEKEVFFDIPELEKMFKKDFNFLGFVIVADSQRDYY